MSNVAVAAPRLPKNPTQGQATPASPAFTNIFNNIGTAGRPRITDNCNYRRPRSPLELASVYSLNRV